jgi:interferon-induced GTP-binding protein Mx
MKKARKKEPWSAVVYTSVNPARKRCNNVPELQASMSQMMDDLCKAAGGDFSTDSVIVELVSEDCCDLTVVDLPGIIRTVTAGQSVDVIQQVNRLIKSYLVDKRTIILAIVPSNQDIATVDILERAQGVDPTGDRTVGVLTKPDLIGPGSEDEVLTVLTNIRKPLKLGYIMLKNRSQKELTEAITTAEAREREEQFFAKHAFWKNSDPKYFGIANLSDKLTNLLVHRIKIELSPMKIEVEKQLSTVRSELRSMASLGTAKTSGDRQKLLVSVIQEYVRQLTDGIRGEYRDRIFVRNADLRLYTAALRAMEAFKLKVLETSPAFKDEDYINSLAVQIEQLRGRELPGFLSTQAFYMCMSLYVDRWEEPMKEMLKEVRKIAQDAAGRLSDVLMAQFPALRDSIRFAASTVLSEIFDEILNTLDLVLEREKDPFTLNDFLQQWVNKLRFDGFSNAVDGVFDGLNPSAAAASGTNAWNAATKDEVFIGLRQWYRQTHSVSAMANAQDMCAILEAYWSLSMKRFVDNCCMVADKELLCKLPMAIQDHMYKYVRDDASLSVSSVPFRCFPTRGRV